MNIAALIDSIHDRDCGRRRGEQPEGVEPQAMRPVGLGEEPPRRGEGDDADRDVDVEDEAPGEVLHEPAAEHRPHGGGEQHRDAEDAHDAAHVLGADRSHDDGHADRHEHAAAESLEHAEEHQLREVLRDPAGHRREREERDGHEI
jgi:hypothetical protein